MYPRSLQGTKHDRVLVRQYERVFGGQPFQSRLPDLSKAFLILLSL